MIFVSLNLNAYDKKLERYIDSIIEKKIADYKIVKDENKRLKQRVTQLESRLNEVEDSVESVETRTLVDKIKFGLGFSTTMNSYDKKYADGYKVYSKNLYTTKLMLNMESDITKDMKFTGRLSMYKYWADSTIHTYSRYDNMQGRVPSSSTLFVERAYVDWRFTDSDATFPSVLTIGRQPSSDGPSHQFKANTARKATYSALVFDGASDGVVLTSSLKNITSLKNANLRFAYGKGFQNDENNRFVTNAFIGSDNSLKDTDVYGLFFESSILNKSNTLFQIGVAQMDNIVANSLETNTSANKNVGDVTFAGVMFEGTNINNSGWDAFAHFAYSHAKPNSNIYNFNGQKLSLLNNGVDTSTKNATAMWLGTRYTFDNKSKIGFEYNQASKYWVSATQGAFDLVNKLATRGKAYEAYYIYPINRFSYLKLGGMYVDYDYTKSGWFLGKPEKFSDLSADMKKSSIDSIKNVYLQFGLNY
jgi:hypothetical protein